MEEWDPTWFNRNATTDTTITNRLPPRTRNLPLHRSMRRTVFEPELAGVGNWKDLRLMALLEMRIQYGQVGILRQRWSACVYLLCSYWYGSWDHGEKRV